MANTPARTKISVNLDEIEQKDVKEPFVAVIGGKEITFTDPELLDWEDLASLESPGDFVDMCLDTEDRTYVYDQKLPAYKFRALWEAYQNHYGLLQSRGNRRG